MSRTKSITEKQILNTAYDLVVDGGFKNFTARNIARVLGCSTQPIYLEFSSMGRLKVAVMEKIKQELVRKLSKRYTLDPVVDLGLAYINFALGSSRLYHAVFIEDHFGVEEMRDFAMETALKRFDDYAPAAKIPLEQRRNALMGLWIVATGISNLQAAGYVTLSREQMTDILQAVVQDFMLNGRFTQNAKALSDHYAIM